jgi:membrane protein DedA with SNARE-associated domain
MGKKEKVFTRQEMQGTLIICIIVAFIAIMISDSIGYNQGRSDVEQSLAHKAEYVRMLRELEVWHQGKEIDSLILSHEQELVTSIDSAFKAE